MRSPIAAKMLFAMFMAYAHGNLKNLFGNEPAAPKRRLRPKNHPGTRHVFFSGPGQYHSPRIGPKGKAAKKIAKKASHVKGYYRKLRKGELTA